MRCSSLRASSRALSSRYQCLHHSPLLRSHPSSRQCLRLLPPRAPASCAHTGRFGSDIRNQRRQKEASYSPYLVLVALVATTAAIVEYATATQADPVASQAQAEQLSPSVQTPHRPLPAFAGMPIPEGHVGNLTAEQEEKLKEFWTVLLKIFGVKDPDQPETTVRPETPVNGSIQAPDSAKKEKRGWFRRHKESVSSPTTPSFGSGDPDDKYGHMKELQEILATAKPEDLHTAFWSMIKNDHPDGVLLRFLRARKWDVHRALAMLIATIHWRKHHIQVDGDIMKNGEGAALAESESNRDSADFMAQLRMGKSFLHGVDKEGRPMSFIRVRLHRGGEQTEKSIERFTVYLIETARLTLIPPVETATLVFDMTGFTLANMDYTPVKFMIKVFEANYPESLGCVLVHNAPWIFQGIWKIIKGWLDPVVAGKIIFTSGLEGLEEYVQRSQIIKELGGDEDWEYKYIEPVPNENAPMNDEAAKKEFFAVRHKEEKDFERNTFEYLKGKDVRTDRDNIAKQLRKHYWNLDPLIRARSVYDRTGLIGKDGTIDYYPTQTVKLDNLPTTNGVKAAEETNGIRTAEEAKAAETTKAVKEMPVAENTTEADVD